MLATATMAHDFASEEDLLDRLTAQPDDVVYLVGSAVTAPARAGEPGVPRVDGVIEEIRRVYTRADALERLERALAAEPQARYQAAFRHLQRTRGQDLANAIIRRCVLRARVPSARYPQVHADIAEQAAELCRSLEQDLDGWHLPAGVAALGQILARRPASERPVVLTSNFDPLVSVSVHRAGGRAYTTALHSDGGFAAIDGHGTLVVHFHGDWFRSDTLHTPTQLGQERPRLAGSLAQLLGARTLVVLGYGGWDDIFTRSLAQVVRGDVAPIDVLWTFYPRDPAAIAAGAGGLLAGLQPGIERGRVMLYAGIDVHAFLPRLAAALGATGGEPPRPPAEEPGSYRTDLRGPVDEPGRAVVPSTPRVGTAEAPRPGADERADPGTSKITSSYPAAAPAKNPFQKAGALAPDAPSYVRRPADAALTTALLDHPLIVVRGEFSIGKSSLLLRADAYWGRADAAVCRLDLMDMRIDDVNLFYDEFFAAVGECYGDTVQGWKELAEAARHRPLLLTLDEFSGLTDDVAQRFVPALHGLASRVGEQVRVLVTTRDPLDAVLEGLRLHNPKFREWHTVEVGPLGEAELLALLARLGPRAQAVARAHLEAVRRHSEMAPKPAQCLCFGLWKDEQAGRSDAELTARVLRKESYR
jgi:hypothetical protein